MNDLFKFLDSKTYICLVVFIMMPINGIMFIDTPILSILLILSQIPWFYKVVLKNYKRIE